MWLKKLLLRRTIYHSKYINFAPIAITYQQSEGHYRNGSYSKVAAAVFGSVLIGSAVSKKIDNHKENNETDSRVIEAGAKRPDLPTYKAEEVCEHDSKSSFWVTYRHGVYDITEFLPSHPGGEQILNAAGLSIEPFWNVYGMHKTPEVFKILEQYRIGNLHDDDIVDHSDDELWAREPARDKRLIVKTAKPFNAETPVDLLVENFYTPNDIFFVRQHMPVPELSAHTHRLAVRVRLGETQREESFSLRELERFPRVELSAALMCAGNRRSEMNEVKPSKGIGWGSGAIGCALWSGYALRDVLLHCGVDENDPDNKNKHVILSGADIDATGVQFSTSIPLEMALTCGAVLATHMNGAPLAADHGRPLRAVVPGAPAVRSVKWLESITVSSEESPSHWHQRDYRSFNASTDWDTADFPRAPPVYGLPVTAAACAPAHGQTVSLVDGCVHVKGYAYSGGARVVRVDVSADRGRSWREARLRAEPEPEPEPEPAGARHAWALWELALPVAPTARQVEIWVKATDSNFNTQPEKFDDIWNIRGILANAYHKITVNIEN